MVEPTTPELAAIVMAAGQGTRMRSGLPKAIVPIAGVPIVRRLVDTIRQAGIQRIAVVVGHGAEQVRAALGQEVATPLQLLLDGTASAVEAASEAVDGASNLLVTVGDSPLLRAVSIRALLERHLSGDAACTFLTARFTEHHPYARVLRGADGAVTGCVEERDCTPEQLLIDEYLTSHYLFSAPALWTHLPRVLRNALTGERYLTDILALLVESGERIDALPIDDWRELVGLNTPEDVAWAEGLLRG